MRYRKFDIKELKVTGAQKGFRKVISRCGTGRSSYLHFEFKGDGLGFISDARKMKSLRKMINECLKARKLK